MESNSDYSSDSEIEELVSRISDKLRDKLQKITSKTDVSTHNTRLRTSKKQNLYTNCQLDENAPCDSNKIENEIPSVSSGKQLDFIIDTSGAAGKVNTSDSESDSDDSEERYRNKKQVTKGKKNKHNKTTDGLSSSIKSNISIDNDSYIKAKPKVKVNKKSQPFNIDVVVKGSPSDAEVMKKSVLVADIEKKDVLQPYSESVRQIKKQRKLERSKTKGHNWFNMKAPEMTEEYKNDLTVLHMRKTLDPKRFYKNNDIKALPKFFQFGKVIESPADFYHSRVPKKQRKATMVDELLADAEFRKHNKKKYVEIQDAKRKGEGPYGHVKYPKKMKKS